MSDSPEKAKSERPVEFDPALKNETLKRRVGDYIIWTSYDQEGRLLGETALPTKPMFTDEELIKVGFATRTKAS